MPDINLATNNEIEINNKNDIVNMQDNVLSQILHNAINWSIDAGLRYILPDSIENEVIKIKNDFINGNTAQKIIDNIKGLINSGREKSNNNEILNFDNIKSFFKNPNTISVLTNTVTSLLSENNIDKEKNSEKIIYENIESNLDKELVNQIKSLNKIDSYKDEWYKKYEEKDLKEMNKIFKSIKKEFKNIIPFENTIKEIRKIENLNELIKSKGGDFNITKEEKELVNRLV